MLGIVLRPRDETLKEHVSEVRLRIDRGTAFLKQMEMVNADGERTVVQFPAIEVRQDLREKDLELSVPKGTRVSRPLEGEGGEAVCHDEGCTAGAPRPHGSKGRCPHLSRW